VKIIDIHYERKPESLLTCSQERDTGPGPEQDESNQNPNRTLFL